MTQASVLIVGAHSDIGRALARAYAAAGRDLVLAARQPERLDRDAADLRLRHGVAVTLAEFDILDTARHETLLDELAVLPATVISVVGFMGEQPASEAEPGAAQLVLRSNFEAPALFLGAVAQRMAARGSGAIIGISSVAGERGRATNYVYGSAKAGFTAFLSGLRNRLAKQGVRVITVKPGFVATRMTEGMKLPARLTAQPEEVAAAVLKAEVRGRDILYVRPIWQLVMLVIRLIPEAVFKRLKL
jgi:decaprenylphospho-beta-D-erythro-pentofuranosid-2-ulose 2-reductase